MTPFFAVKISQGSFLGLGLFIRRKKDIPFLLLLSLGPISLSHQNQNGLKTTVKYVMELKRKKLA